MNKKTGCFQPAFASFCLLSAILFFSFGSTGCPFKKGGGGGGSHADKEIAKVLNKLPIEIPGNKLPPNQYKSSGGAPVLTVNAVPEKWKSSLLAIVDAGIDELLQSFAVAYPSYTNGAKYSDYAVLMLPATARTEEGNCPALLTKDNIKIAGIFVGWEGFGMPPALVVAENSNDSEYCNRMTKNAVRYEGEHAKFFFNDQAAFIASGFPGHSHPFAQMPGEAAETGEMPDNLPHLIITIKADGTVSHWYEKITQNNQAKIFTACDDGQLCPQE